MALIETYTRWPIVPAKGEGIYIWDQAGRKYLDFTSGLGVVNIGHCHPEVVQRVEQQLHKLWHVSNLFPIPAQEKLAERLAEVSGLDAAFFCNSGAEANEAAIKLARKAGHEAKGIDQPEIITFKQSFHGRTLATLTATGQDKVKDGFTPLPQGFVTVQWEDFAALENAVTPNTIAVLLEVVQGEGGVRPADQAWLKRVEQLCRDHGLLLMIDEVQTGMGRTGALFAHQHYGIQPDVVTLAKGLGNGLPVGCLLATSKVAVHFGPGSHGSTFGGNPLAMEAGLGVLNVLQQPGFIDRIKAKGQTLHAALSKTLSSHPLVGEVRGLGLMLGIGLCEPRAPELIAALQNEGLLVLPAGSDVVRLLPPLIVEEAEITQAVDILTQVFTATEVGVSS